MKKTIILLIVLLLTLVYIFYSERRIKSLESERDRYSRNTEALLTDIETFKVRDSLNAAKVKGLELSLKEFERYRAEDASLIKQLKAKNRDLEAISKAQSQTIVELSTTAKDTIIIRDSVPIPALSLHAGDAWYDFNGILEGRNFTGVMTSRDSLLIVESVQRKRFLGFLWKTNKIKNREISATSKNPHTMIEGLELITIEKNL
jgi:hypothetical protein